MRWFTSKKEHRYDGRDELMAAIKKREQAADDLMARLERHETDRRQIRERRHLIIPDFSPERRHV